MNNPGAGLTAWLPSRQAGTALPPVVAFGTGIAALFAAGAGWQNAFRWWQRLDGASRALLTVAVAVGLFLLTTAVMLLLPTLTRVYEGNWGKGWPGGRLRSAAARREEARFQRLLHADSERAYAKRYLSFPPRQADIRPTRLGNVLNCRSLWDIWNGSAYQQFRHYIATRRPEMLDACAGCDLPWSGDPKKWSVGNIYRVLRDR